MFLDNDEKGTQQINYLLGSKQLTKFTAIQIFNEGKMPHKVNIKQF